MSDMERDNYREQRYAAHMTGENPFIRLNIEHSQPIELTDFVSAFTGLSAQYQKYMKDKHPDLSEDADLYVRGIRDGSIIADLLPWASNTLPAIVGVMDQLNTVDTFVKAYGTRLTAYFVKGGRAKGVSRSDLRELLGTVKSIARDPNATHRLESVAYENGSEQVRVAIKFDTQQARIAELQIVQHQIEMESTESSERSRVLMIFSQSNIKSSEPGSRTGEKVLIRDISDKELPLIYASDLVEKKIKHEIRDGDDNVFKKGFVVDVSIEINRNGKPIAYRVTDLHQIIDLED